MHTEKTGKQIIDRYKSFFLVTVVGLTLILLGSCQSSQVFQQRFLQFGTIIDISLVTTSEDKALQLFNEIEKLLILRHTEWHGWQDGTLKQFNSALLQQKNSPSADAILIPETLRSLILYSKKYYDLSEGKFNPAMGKLIEAWGFHDKSIPDQSLINKIKQQMPGMHDLIVKDQHAMTLNPYFQLDFGAIAKGLAVKQIAELINQNHIKNFIINAGGDIFAQGQKPGGNWRIAIENPFYDDNHADRVFASIQTTKPLSIFTSGNYHRYYVDKNNIKRHHIIDPTSGEPSINISAITVLHKDPVIADIAATTLMITKISELKKMANKLEIEDFLAISEQQELYISRSMMDKIEWSGKALFSTHPL